MNQDCGAYPFKHCCIGQCREGDLHIKARDALWKLNKENEPLANLTDVLDYFATNIQSDPSSSCNIIFTGDELSSDHVMAASCQLLSTGYKLTSCNPKLGGELYGNDTNVVCDLNSYPTIAHFSLENNSAQSCPKVLLIYTPIHEIARKLRLPSNQVINEAGGIIVFNWGVHCDREHEGCIHLKLSSKLKANFN